jgi:xanthine dehydrogenase accessory factor
MKSLIRSARTLLENGETIVMATVVASSGSTPRSSGAKMLVRRDGSIVGTIGGGLMEAMACRDGRAMLDAGNGAARLTHVDMTQEMAANSDMICGGDMSVLLETMAPNGSGAAACKELDALLRAGKRAVLCTRFSQGESMRAVSHEVFTDPADFPAVCTRAMRDGAPRFESSDTELTIAEPCVPPASLYIFGAGHVSLFTARMGAMLGFRTVVLDDRDDFANKTRFPEADEVRVLNSFNDCCESLPVDGEAFIIILTRGHMHDRTVLARALRTPARYIGMIGSRKKRDAIYAALLAEGFTQTDIDRCHCPIGLTIGAQTPEEIAVSIAAELIAVRSGHGA